MVCVPYRVCWIHKQISDVWPWISADLNTDLKEPQRDNILVMDLFTKVSFFNRNFGFSYFWSHIFANPHKIPFSWQLLLLQNCSQLEPARKLHSFPNKGSLENEFFFKSVKTCWKSQKNVGFKQCLEIVLKFTVSSLMIWYLLCVI